MCYKIIFSSFFTYTKILKKTFKTILTLSNKRQRINFFKKSNFTGKRILSASTNISTAGGRAHLPTASPVPQVPIYARFRCLLDRCPAPNRACRETLLLDGLVVKKLVAPTDFYPSHAGSSIRVGTKGRLLGSIASFVRNYGPPEYPGDQANTNVPKIIYRVLLIGQIDTS